MVLLFRNLDVNYWIDDKIVDCGNTDKTENIIDNLEFPDDFFDEDTLSDYEDALSNYEDTLSDYEDTLSDYDFKDTLSNFGNKKLNNNCENIKSIDYNEPVIQKIHLNRIRKDDNYDSKFRSKSQISNVAIRREQSSNKFSNRNFRIKNIQKTTPYNNIQTNTNTDRTNKKTHMFILCTRSDVHSAKHRKRKILLDSFTKPNIMCNNKGFRI